MRSTRRRLAATLALALGALLVLAPAAMAADGVMAFFTILVIVLSLVQIRLDNRKERRKQDLERLGRP
jgi:hypothetical protein